MAQSLVGPPGPGTYGPTLTVQQELDGARQLAKLASTPAAPTRQPPGKARSTTASAARPVTEGTASSAGIGNGGRRSALSPTSPRAQASVLAETERVVEEAEQALRMYREMNLRAR